jgi:septal ring factor EnvC (AmiA/AmiB activator)
MRQHLLRGLLVAVAAACAWASLAVVGGTPGLLYAAGTIVLGGVLFWRLNTKRDALAPLPERPWNKKARRIQDLETQIAQAITELSDRAHTIDDLRAHIRQQAADHDALQKRMQAQLVALAARLRSHESELASFERQLGTAPAAESSWARARA